MLWSNNQLLKILIGCQRKKTWKLILECCFPTLYIKQECQIYLKPLSWKIYHFPMWTSNTAYLAKFSKDHTDFKFPNPQAPPLSLPMRKCKNNQLIKWTSSPLLHPSQRRSLISISSVILISKRKSKLERLFSTRVSLPPFNRYHLFQEARHLSMHSTHRSQTAIDINEAPNVNPNRKMENNLPHILMKTLNNRHYHIPYQNNLALN